MGKIEQSKRNLSSLENKEGLLRRGGYNREPPGEKPKINPAPLDPPDEPQSPSPSALSASADSADIESGDSDAQD